MNKADEGGNHRRGDASSGPLGLPGANPHDGDFGGCLGSADLGGDMELLGLHLAQKPVDLPRVDHPGAKVLD